MGILLIPGVAQQPEILKNTGTLGAGYDVTVGRPLQTSSTSDPGLKSSI